MWEEFIPPRPHPNSDRAYYRREAWASLEATRQAHKQDGRMTGDEGAYLPNPDEIDERIGIMRWLESLGFNHLFVTSVMVHGDPSLKRVCQMIERHGPIETYRRLRPFLHD